MEALLSGDGPDHSTAWRGPGRGGTDGRLTDSLSGIYSASVHAFRLGPQGCGPPKGAKQITRTAGILDGRVSRGLSYPHLPPILLSTPPHVCTLSAPLLRNSGDSKVRFKYSLLFFLLFYPSPDCCSRVSIWVYPTPKSVHALAEPLCCQILCSAAVLWQRRTVAGWHTGSAASGFRPTHYHA